MTKILKHFKPYTSWIVVILLLTIGQVAAVLELPKMMSNIVDIGIIGKGITDPLLLHTANSTTQLNYILSHGALMLLVAAASVACSVSAGYGASRVSAGVARDLRDKIFAKVESFSLADIDRFSIASLIIRSTNDIAQVQQISFMLLRIALVAPLTAVGAIFMSYRTDAGLTWILGIALPILLGVIIGMGIYAMPLFRRVQKQTDALNLVAREGLTGVRVIRAFNRVDTQSERFDEANRDLTATTLKVNGIMVTLMPVISIIVQLVLVAIIWFGAHLIDSGQGQIGGLMAFLQYAMNIMFSLMMLSMIFIMIPRASVSAERINEVLVVEPSISDGPGCVVDDETSIQFENVSFAFEGAEQPSLNDISFSARAGTTTAIIGSTGSGKSTLINLLLRLYDPTHGEIFVSGCNIKDFVLEDLRALIGYTPQKALLFSGTIADNLRVGREDATEEDMWHALRVAQAEDFVSKLPEQLESSVSQGGTNFSGGQKQRLAIARAIIARPRIYLFDDTFSALDMATDARLREALKPETSDSVVITVAQRISAVSQADQIIVLDDGHIVGIGTHEYLLESNEVYREIAASQLSEEEMSA